MPSNTSDKDFVRSNKFNINQSAIQEIDDEIFTFNIAPDVYDVYVDYNNVTISSDQFNFECAKPKLNIQNNILSVIIIKSNNSFKVLLKNPKIDFTDNRSSFHVKMKNDFLVISISTAFKITVDHDNLLFSSTESEDIVYNKNFTEEQKAEISQMHDNKTLLISEEKNRTFLPYTVKEICEKFDSTKYSTIQDFINKEYTISNDYFRFPMFSRFNEGYKLVREKEHGTRKAAINLALELMFNFHLNPSIITACRNLEELNIYLDCLEENELNNFACFDIIYEVTPAKI